MAAGHNKKKLTQTVQQQYLNLKSPHLKKEQKKQASHYKTIT
jgi:hypothetical protein